jgi:L-2,4-diaminobutyrate transaminase
VPLSACLVSERVWRVVADAGAVAGVFGHGYTYSSHPLAAAVAMTNLDLIENEDLVAKAALRGAHLHGRLREELADHPLVGEVRGQALIAAVEFVRERDPARAFDAETKVAARITRRCLELGLITRALPAADAISFAPPFVISEEEIDELVRTTRRAVDDVYAELRQEGAVA